MEKQLRISLLEGWVDITHENPDGPTTLYRTASENPAVLQISVQATYTGGKKPDSTLEDLIGLAHNMIINGGGEVTQTNSGKCEIGLFGAAQGKLPNSNFFRIWVLSNGYDFVLATQTAPVGMPDNQDLKEGHSTVMNLNYT